MIGSQPPAYFDRTYNEAMALLIEARDYARLTRDKPPQTAPADMLVIQCEAFRLTTRLTQVMSWLMARRALLNGELTPDQFAAQDWRLGAQKTCRDYSAHDHRAIAPRLRDLLRRSHRLYERISRLDEIATHNLAPPPTGYPSAHKPNT